MDKINAPILFFVTVALLIIVITLIFGLGALTLIGVVASFLMLVLLVALSFPKNTSE